MTIQEQHRQERIDRFNLVADYMENSTDANWEKLVAVIIKSENITVKAVVSGGVCTDAYSTHPSVDFDVIDMDNLADEMGSAFADKDLDKQTEKLSKIY
jgi:hypothetical protein